MAPPTAMFRASIVLVNQPGSGGGTGPMTSPAIPDPRNTTAYAAYQRAADLTSLNTSAPSGARIPHRPTPPASRNPPSGIIESVGASRIASWPTRSSHGKSRVRENTAIAPSRTPKYTSGTTPTGEPNARYSAPHSAATGKISTEIRTSSALRARRSSSSRGSAPTRERRSAAARILSRRCMPGDVTRRKAGEPVPSQTERMIEANGVALCTEPFGDPADPAILLVMGVGGSMLWWEEGFCRMLADGGRFVIRYDHRDTGRSVAYEPGRPEYTGADLVADAAGVLDAYEIPAAHVVGASAGGAFAQLLALDYPERVRSLSLISTSYAVPTDRELPAPTEEFSRFVASVEVDWSDPE